MLITIRKIVGQWKPFLWVNLLFVIYTIVFIAWSDLLYIYQDFSMIEIIGIGILLIPFYTFLNLKAVLGKWAFIFYIPFYPYILYLVLLGPIWYSIFPSPYPDQEDFGAGITSVIAVSLNWLCIIISMFISKRIKKK